MLNKIYQQWYSEARFESGVRVLCNMGEDLDFYATEQMSFIDAPDLIPAGSMCDTETGYEDWNFGSNPMASHVLR